MDEFNTNEYFKNLLERGQITEEEYNNAIGLINEFKLEFYGQD